MHEKMMFIGSSIESLLWDLPRLNLDSTDLKILNMLASDGGPVDEIHPGDVVWFPRVRSIGTAPRQ
jgi:hypothetical protein